jgi:O-antigen/teichoic acid export membrane protein
LSKLLTLELFGYYTLAATLCGVIPLAIVPITQAVYPRLVELASRGDSVRLVQTYHRSAQLVTVLTAPVMGLLVVFADGILFLWTGDRSVAEKSAQLMSALAFGTFLNGLMYVPAQLQLAYGWTRLGIATNAVAVAIVVPAIILIVPEYGALGAAWVWIALNAGYVLISMQFMHRRLVRTEKFRWYWMDVAMPASAAFFVVVVARLVRPMGLDHRWQWLVVVSIAGSLSLTAAVLSAPELRRSLGASVGKVLKLS